MAAILISKVFLSTLSLRRATIRKRQIIPIIQNFYPRSPCGERRRESDTEERSQGISIHALLAESDGVLWLKCARRFKFLSTLSLRRATVDAELAADEFDISIHALLAESDAG